MFGTICINSISIVKLSKILVDSSAIVRWQNKIILVLRVSDAFLRPPKSSKNAREGCNPRCGVIGYGWYPKYCYEGAKLGHISSSSV